MIDTDRLLTELNTATQDLDPPLAVIDLAALDANRRDLANRAGTTPIRVASKSLRCRWVLTEVLADPHYRGVLAFTLAEALWLAEPAGDWRGIEDVVIGYPTVDRASLRRLADSSLLRDRVTLMIDDIAHVAMLSQVAADADTTLRVAIDVDSSWRPRPFGRDTPLHVGARRSPVHDRDQAVRLTRSVAADPNLLLTGLMFYEAQIAGLGDRPAGNPLRGRAIHLMQRASGAEIAQRRPQIVRATNTELARFGQPELEFVNAGGTGSLELSSSDASVTEVTAGSGLFGPTLFDTYAHFEPAPAACFALPVVRRPAPGMVTVLGGGYVASGIADPSRLPTPWLPGGLKLNSQEGAGEVQTPLHGSAADGLAIGDRVWFRHAKAGELAERFADFHLVRAGELVGQKPTYRGEGKTFL
ncbi:MAG: amino acid deaminase/aldolase [Candidatus Nanopelagicales bacterium]